MLLGKKTSNGLENMKKLIIFLIFILYHSSIEAQINHDISINYCGITYSDKYGFNFQKAQSLKYKIQPFSYIFKYKRIGIEFFFNFIKSEYISWRLPQDPLILNVLQYRDRTNLGLCFHYVLLKKRYFNLSLYSGLFRKASSDFTYLYTYYGSFPEPRFALNNESGFGIVTGVNAKIFFHKRIFLNATIRQMNLVDDSKFQRNALMTEFGLGVRLGKLSFSK